MSSRVPISLWRALAPFGMRNPLPDPPVSGERQTVPGFWTNSSSSLGMPLALGEEGNFTQEDDTKTWLRGGFSFLNAFSVYPSGDSIQLPSPMVPWPDVWTPTQNEEAGVATFSDSASSSDAYKAFASGQYGWHGDGAWIMFELPDPDRHQAYGMTFGQYGGTSSDGAFVVEGSFDGSSWTELATSDIGESDVGFDVAFSNIDFYKFYRITFSGSPGFTHILACDFREYRPVYPTSTYYSVYSSGSQFTGVSKISAVTFDYTADSYGGDSTYVKVLVSFDGGTTWLDSSFSEIDIDDIGTGGSSPEDMTTALADYVLPFGSTTVDFAFGIATDGDYITPLVRGVTLDYYPETAVAEATDYNFLLSSDTAPGSFAGYAAPAFRYAPALRVAKSFENDLGITPASATIAVEYWGTNRDNVVTLTGYLDFSSATMQIYDDGEYFWIYPDIPALVDIGAFSELLFELTYVIESKVTVVKHQRVQLYSPALGEAAFITAGSKNGVMYLIVPVLSDGVLYKVTSIPGFMSNFTNTGHFDVQAVSFIPDSSQQAVTYVTSDGVTHTVLLSCPGQDIFGCGEANSNAGGQGTISYKVNCGTIAGLMRFTYQHYIIPDQVTVEFPIGSTVFSTGGLVGGSGDVAFMKPAGVVQGRITVVAPLEGTLWNNSIACPNTYSTYTATQQFTSVTQQGLWVESVTPGTYVPAVLGVDYTWVSGTTYAAVSTVLQIAGADDSMYVTLSLEQKYLDPFSGAPVYHIKGTLLLKDRTIVGNGGTGDTIIKELSGAGDIYQQVLISEFNSAGQYPYRPLMFVPVAAGDFDVSFLGTVEYEYDHSITRYPVRCSGYLNVPLLDLLGYINEVRYNQVIKSNAYKSPTRFVPKSTAGAGVLTPHIEGAAGVLVQPYSQPFYGKGAQSYILRYRLGPYGTVNSGTLTLAVTDPTNGNYSAVVDDVPYNATGNEPEYQFNVRFAGNDATGVSLTITDHDTERFLVTQEVYEVVADLAPSGTVAEPSVEYLVFKEYPTQGAQSYQLASFPADYTVSVGVITAVNAVTVAKMVLAYPT